jgi:mannosyltransferase OCH1-like enzyme
VQISQAYFSSNKTPLPPYLGECVETAKQIFPMLRHVLYDMESAREFIAKQFGSEVVTAFDKLNPYAYKVDLFRYCVLHAVGGWYFDIAVRPLARVNVPQDIETIAFRDMMIFSQTNWACSTGILYARPNSAVYQKAIELAVGNCKSNYYGINPLCPTGPVVLGKAFALQGESSNRLFGDLMVLTPNHNKKNIAYVLHDGTIFAFGKPAGGGDLTQVGASGTNNYNDFYAARTVYKG